MPWQYLQQEGLLEDPVELLGDIELLHSLQRFFDRATYSASIGYESAHKQADESATAGARARPHNSKSA